MVNGQQVGPLSFEELRLQNLTPESMVWREGLTEWVAASSIPELSPILLANTAETVKAPHQPGHSSYAEQPNYPQQPYQQPQQSYNNSYSQPYNQGNYNPIGNPIPHTNWLPWAIITTIISTCTTCIGLFLGIIAIIYASRANTFYNNGQKADGDAANSTARILTIINIVLCIIGIIVSLFYLAMLPLALLGVGV